MISTVNNVDSLASKAPPKSRRPPTPVEDKKEKIEDSPIPANTSVRSETNSEEFVLTTHQKITFSLTLNYNYYCRLSIHGFSYEEDIKVTTPRRAPS